MSYFNGEGDCNWEKAIDNLAEIMKPKWHKNKHKDHFYKKLFPSLLPLFPFPPPDKAEETMAESYPFPSMNATAAPSPSSFFSDDLRISPIPTNTAWQNFVLKAGDQPEYIHPYQIRLNHGSVSISYPNRAVTSNFIFQAICEDLRVSCGTGAHQVISYDDLSVVLNLPGPMVLPLARGSPYVTFLVNGGTLNLKTIHAVVNFSSNFEQTKFRISFNNNQIWLIYTSRPLSLDKDLAVSGTFNGVLRIALLSDNPDEDEDSLKEKEGILDQHSNLFPVSGSADVSVPFRVVYKWKTRYWGDVPDGVEGPLMLAHSLHRQILVSPGRVNNLSYRSIDGELIGIAGDTWLMQENKRIPIGWYSHSGFHEQEGIDRVKEALKRDVDSLSVISNNSTYFFGKAIARVARLALIAEEIHCFDVLGQIRACLADSLEPWLDGTYEGNGLFYDAKYGGLISRNGAADTGADFGHGLYNDHHYHFGYFCYAIAVLAKLDPRWARKYKAHAYALAKDFMTLNPRHHSRYTRLRNFDLWTMHSWASGITEFTDGRNQESSSEAVNAYYSVALLGLAYGDPALLGTASTLTALEIRAAKTFWHIPSGSTIYDQEFVEANRILGIVWGNKRDTNLWWATGEWRECRMGIQLIPLVPITESLFDNKDYVEELVEWTLPALKRSGVTDGWRGFVYALQAVYDKDAALSNILQLNSHDDGNSLTNLLWWVYTRCPKKAFSLPWDARTLCETL